MLICEKGTRKQTYVKIAATQFIHEWSKSQYFENWAKAVWHPLQVNIFLQASNQGWCTGELGPLAKFLPPGKICWTQFENIGPLSENSSTPLVSQAGYGPVFLIKTQARKPTARLLVRCRKSAISTYRTGLLAVIWMNHSCRNASNFTVYS